MEYVKPEVLVFTLEEITNIRACANSGNCSSNTWGCNCGGACWGENLG